MNDIAVIGPASAADFKIAMDWAASEGWNPGLDDLEAFYRVDPDGFLIASLDSVPIATISVVRYGDSFAFLGCYIVHPDHRGTGTGLAIWRAGMDRLEGRTVGLDGVVDQQENYRKSGFEPAGRNIRYQGVPVPTTPDPAPNGVSLCPIDSENLDAAIRYDAAFFPDDRSDFMTHWLAGDTRQSRLALKDGAIVGLGTIRACRLGYKIGPLFADTPDIANALFEDLCATLPKGAPVTLDVPDANENAVALVKRAGLLPVFEAARMYRGPAPALPLERTFGITTFELG